MNQQESENNPTGPVSDELYQLHMKNFPIFCVDIVFFNKTKTQTLLFKRINKPQQGVYFTAGGGVLKNESLEDAVARKAKQETGLIIDTEKLVFGGVISERHPDSAFEGINYHSITAYYGYILDLDDNKEIKLDFQNDEYKWFAVDDQAIHPFIKERIVNSLKAFKLIEGQ